MLIYTLVIARHTFLFSYFTANVGLAKMSSCTYLRLKRKGKSAFAFSCHAAPEERREFDT